MADATASRPLIDEVEIQGAAGDHQLGNAEQPSDPAEIGLHSPLREELLLRHQDFGRNLDANALDALGCPRGQIRDATFTQPHVRQFVHEREHACHEGVAPVDEDHRRQRVDDGEAAELFHRQGAAGVRLHDATLHHQHARGFGAVGHGGEVLVSRASSCAQLRRQAQNLRHVAGDGVRLARRGVTEPSDERQRPGTQLDQSVAVPLLFARDVIPDFEKVSA